MKYFSQIFAPTNNRRLNELIGFLLCVSGLLLFLALASYSPLDPSFNSASVLTGSRAARNWIGLVGAIVSDLMLQGFGIGAFLIPVFFAALVPLAQSGVACSQVAWRNLAAAVCSRPAGALARTCALAGRDSDGRSGRANRWRRPHPLLEPGGRIYRVRDGLGRSVVSDDCLLFRIAEGLGSDSFRFCDR